MQLRKMHPLLPALTAAEYVHRAALGLERHHHETGIAMLTWIEMVSRDASLHWDRSSSGDVEQLDRIRITEDAAEAIALALVHVVRGWVVRRRLQRGESADWLLRDPEARLVALEISGIDEGDLADRLRVKLAQVRRATFTDHRAACVI